ncbi:MAG: hypothetical protein ACM3UU_08620 [Ignavibacteriales bacterium]
MEIRKYDQFSDDMKKRIRNMADEAINNTKKAFELFDEGNYLESIDLSSEAIFWASRAVANFFDKDSDSLIALAEIMHHLVEHETIEPIFYDTIIDAIGISSSELEEVNDVLFKEHSKRLLDHAIELVKVLKNIIF